jgi:hypothetical protein
VAAAVHGVPDSQVEQFVGLALQGHGAVRQVALWRDAGECSLV